MAPILGKIIKRHRILRDMSVKDLDTLADLSYGYCLEIERGSYDPGIKTLAKIAKALKTPLWMLIKETEEAEEEEENAENAENATDNKSD